MSTSRTFIPPELQDFILFGSKRCPACLRKLPRCADWFAVDESTSDGLTSHCKECRAEGERRRR